MARTTLPNDAYVYDPGEAWGPSDYDATHMFKIWGVWSPTIFKDGGWREKVLGGWTISGIFNAHSGFPFTPVYAGQGCGVIYAGSRGNCDLRPASYLGGALDRVRRRCLQAAGRQLPGRRLGVLHGNRLASRVRRSTRSHRAPCRLGRCRDDPGSSATRSAGRATSTSTRRSARRSVCRRRRGWATPRELEFRANFFNLFNQVNLYNVQNNILDAHFGEAQDGLAGRTIEMQVRFSF